MPGGSDDGYVPPALRAKLTAVAHGNFPCDASCEAELARELRAYGSFAEWCAAILAGKPVWPGPSLWLPALRSNLPVWGLLVRAGHAATLTEQSWGELWPRLMPTVKGWWTNLCSTRVGWGTQGLSHFLKQVKLWPSLPMQTEMLLIAAQSLLVGAHVDLPVRWFAEEPACFGLPLKVVCLAAERFVELAAEVAANVSDDLWRTPRVLGTLYGIEYMRMSSWYGLAAYLSETHVCVFAGANTGSMLAHYRVACPKANIHAFEADPFFFESLQEKMVRSRTLTLNNLALHSLDKQRLVLRTRNGVGSQSSLWESTDLARNKWPSIMQSLEQGRRVVVETAALGPWAKRQGLKKIDMVYLDIECSELNALRGLRQFLPNVTVLHLEVNNAPVCQGAPLWPAVRRFLHARGFRPLFVPSDGSTRETMDITAIRDPSVAGVFDAAPLKESPSEHIAPLDHARKICQGTRHNWGSR